MTEGDLQALGEQALEEIAGAVDQDQLERVRLKYLGRHGGLISLGAQALAQAAPEQRAGLGRAFNAAKEATEAALARRLGELRASRRGIDQAEEWLDLTYPTSPLPRGHQHPVARLIREIEDIGRALGYESVRGPEVEDDQYNFELLNLPPDHPARDTHDTFYLAGPAQGWLLRTHTSPVQLRTMMAGPPPYRILAPGRVYRRDNPDPTHNPMFHQVEGLCVDTNITFGDLKGTLDFAMKAFFGSSVKTRFFPSFFPFTEPSADVQISCPFCGGSGCRKCKYSGWIELLGCGMVDPAVFGFVQGKQPGYDPKKISGFAFGMGIDRIAMMKYGIGDIGLLYSGDLRFLEQFA